MPRHPLRHWKLEGATNFRDLGGYPGHEGRPLRWRRIFRSDHLGALSEADRRRLAELGLAAALDLRGEDESAAASYAIEGVTRHALAIEPSVVSRLQEEHAAGRALDAALAAEMMRELYERLVQDHVDRYAALFDHLLAARAPLVFHCTAGKDRTGVAAALVLLALGVPRPLVLQDYLLSNEHYRRPPQPPGPLPGEVLDVMWNVQAGFLEHALAIVEREPGGVDGYLRQRLGLTDAARRELAARYLED